MASAVGPIAQRTADALVFADRAVMRAYQLQQTAADQSLADELFELHVALAHEIEWLLGAKRGKRPSLTDRAYLYNSA